MTESWPTLGRRDAPADIILLLEGTYPMVRGGVAGWVDQLIRGLPTLRFAVVFLGGRRQDYQGILFERPANLVHLQCHYLMEDLPTPSSAKQCRGNPAAFATSRRMHETFRDEEGDIDSALGEVARLIGQRGGIRQEEFLFSQEAWNEIVARYHRDFTEPSFIDYFWSVRNMHAPLFLLEKAARHLPRGRCLHAISTGYAGFLGALAHHVTGLPLLVTEHGIYTKERQIDLIEAKWIRSPRDTLAHGFQTDTGYLRNMWIRFFQGLGRMTYAASHVTTTLYGGNQARQIKDGARPETARVIPNGIHIERFRPLREATAANTRPIVVLLGRVTPIKDIKTFIRAIHQLLGHLPEVEGWVVGPASEDPTYAQECQDLAIQLGLGERLRFLGFQRTETILAQARLVVLTSISEAQPLVLLEAMAAGLPVVSSDVGACREMILGTTADDAPAGRVVPIANPSATANAIAELLEDPQAWHAAREAGIRRVEADYTEALMLSRYLALFEETIGMTHNRSDKGAKDHGGNRIRTA